MITKKVFLLIGMVIILSFAVVYSAPFPYGTVLNQTQYDSLPISISLMNIQVEKDKRGQITPYCDKLTQLCTINLTYDYFDKELELIYRPNIKGQLIPEYNETGNYIFVNKKTPITFSLNTYVQYLKGNKNAILWVRQIIKTKANHKAYNLLDHLQKMQTVTTSSINLGTKI